MANTAYLRYGVEPWVRDQLRVRYGQPFHPRVLTLVSGGRREFDAVSADERVVAAIKTSSGLTSGGRVPAGKINACLADLYYLSLVGGEIRLLILTDPEFYGIFTRRVDGALAPGISVEFMPLPTDIQRQVDGVRRNASAEMGDPMKAKLESMPRTQRVVENAIREAVSDGAVLRTPTRQAEFIVDRIDDRGVALLFGKKRTSTRITWDCLEGIPAHLAGKGWMPIGTSFDVDGRDGTLDGYLKGFTKRGTAAWVAALLEAAGIVKIDRAEPAKVVVAMAETSA